ncbi:MAG: carboxypeptidase regulatory-like domain-containing protein [Acidobacteriaceae bacterium]|nr:carboxypeptidase regulatory-like domain-containing protein [Acidobacteriaceae bacterium]
MNLSFTPEKRVRASRRVSHFVFCLALLVGLSSHRAWSQATSSATVTGQALDPQGAALPGAEVRLTDTATNATSTATTNDAGRYVFVNVTPGTYVMGFSKAGFASYRVSGQEVEVGTTLTVNATLQLGSTTTTVEVQAQSAAELQTTNAAVGTTLSSNAILSLPNLGRDVATLAVLQPGVTAGGYTAGAVQDQNTYTIDGGNNSDDMSGNMTSYTTNFTGLGGVQTGGTPSGVVPTPVESIEEFKVTTFNQTADFNSSMGSQVQMVTKRGTNQFHGAAYGYYFATNLGAANSWTNNHTPSNGLPYTPLPSNHRDRFGGAIGGPLAPNFLGGKWYFFFNYEGSRFPNVTTYERPVPTALMRAGVIQVPNSAGTYVPYNLNKNPVTVNGATYQPAACPNSGNGLCDPRGIGINPIVSQIWNTQMPLPNDPTFASNGADTYNVAGYISTIRAPLTSDTYVGRVDHDFTDKWHFMSSYRFMRLVNLTTNQVDIGGALSGDVLGQPTAVAPRDQVPSMYVAGLTTILSPSATNNFVYSYTRNFWQWGSVGAPPQVAGLGGAAEIASGGANAIAESATAATILIPYNINTQSVRQRFWDGQDNMFKDDLTIIKGDHLIQFGGLYQRNLDYHMRTDNGNGVNNQIVYQIGSQGINFTNSPYIPSAVPSTQQSTYRNLYSEVLGLVNQPQVAYTRAGSNLTLQPVGSVATDKSIIPSYNLYISDTWHMKPNFTFTYGLSWALEMPPYELNGKQVLLVNPATGNPVDAESYLAQRKAAALQGQVYNPQLGFETIKNTGRKYPYNPVWTEFSPRLALAWNPKYSSGLLGSLLGDGKTVFRGGYGRIYGRLNGVNLVLVPLLGPGLLQAVSCPGASSAGTCLGSGNVSPATAFRLGTDGSVAPLPAASQTLPQPFLPGVNGAYAQDPSALDLNYKPERTDNFTFSIQRAIGTKMTLEAGYIGRIIRNEEQEINIDAVPYMTTLNGQSFAQAYAATYFALSANNFATNTAVAPQPFFEASLGGANSTYCKGASSCTAALVTANASLFKQTAVSDIWKAMNAAKGWTLGNTMLDVNQMSSMGLITSLGYGNYNALFVTWRARDFHGVSLTSNFTYGHALGTAATTQATSSATATDPFNIGSMYGSNSFDVKFIYNVAMTYQPPYFRTQKGIVGHILGGWTISPLFTAQSGAPIGISYSEGNCTACEGFGEVTPSSGVTSAAENAVGTGVPYTGGNSAHYNVSGSNGVGTNNVTGVNMFANPAAVLAEFRPCILGYDTSCGGYGNIRGLPTWNLDAQLLKDIGVWKEGRVGATFSFQFTNVLNHAQLGTGTTNGTLQYGPNSISLTTPTQFGRITTQANTPRNMEFGLRIHF